MSSPYYLKRKEQHLCARCGKQDERTLSGRTYCEACAQLDREQYGGHRRDIYQQRKEQHRCINCGEQDERTLAGKTQCMKCSERTVERHRELCKSRTAEARCARCGGQDERTLSGKEFCEKCAADRSVHAVRRSMKAVEDGRCCSCGKTGLQLNESGMCSECAEKRRETTRTTKKQHLQDRLCVECGRQDERTLSGRWLCTECAGKLSIYQKEKRQYLKTSGRCARCGSKDARTMTGKTMCGECASRLARCRARETYRQAENAKRREKYRERAELGVCRLCGGELPEDSEYVLCQKCRDKAKEQRRLRKSREDHFVDPDLCTMCHRRPKLDGYKVCEECYMRCKRNRMGIKKPPEDHWWRIYDRQLFGRRGRSEEDKLPEV